MRLVAERYGQMMAKGKMYIGAPEFDQRREVTNGARNILTAGPIDKDAMDEVLYRRKHEISTDERKLRVGSTQGARPYLDVRTGGHLVSPASSQSRLLDTSSACAAYRRSAIAISYTHLADHPGRNQPGSGHLTLRQKLAWLEAEGDAGPVGLEFRPTGTTADALKVMRESLG